MIGLFDSPNSISFFPNFPSMILKKFPFLLSGPFLLFLFIFLNFVDTVCIFLAADFYEKTLKSPTNTQTQKQEMLRKRLLKEHPEMFPNEVFYCG